MADTPTTDVPVQNSDAPAQEFTLQSVYVKDVSFEAPLGPNLQVTEWNPQIGLNMTTAGETVAENMHEVVLTITVDAKLADKTAFLVEVKQAGLFMMRGYPVEESRRIIGSYCPNVLFPYARQVISDLITRGGFPPFLLPPVNFDGLYQQSLQQAAAQAPTDSVN
jgi:preprotein translocase subunit SecB